MNTITDKLMTFVLGKDLAQNYGYKVKEEKKYKFNPHQEDFNEEEIRATENRIDELEQEVE